MVTREQFLAWVMPPDEHREVLFFTTQILPALYPQGLSEDELPGALARELGVSRAEALKRMTDLREWIESRNRGEGLEKFAPDGTPRDARGGDSSE